MNFRGMRAMRCRAPFTRTLFVLLSTAFIKTNALDSAITTELAGGVTSAARLFLGPYTIAGPHGTKDEAKKEKLVQKYIPQTTNPTQKTPIILPSQESLSKIAQLVLKLVIYGGLTPIALWLNFSGNADALRNTYVGTNCGYALFAMATRTCENFSVPWVVTSIIALVFFWIGSRARKAAAKFWCATVWWGLFEAIYLVNMTTAANQSNSFTGVFGGYGFIWALLALVIVCMLYGSAEFAHRSIAQELMIALNSSLGVTGGISVLFGALKNEVGVFAGEELIHVPTLFRWTSGSSRHEVGIFLGFFVMGFLMLRLRAIRQSSENSFGRDRSFGLQTALLMIDGLCWAMEIIYNLINGVRRIFSRVYSRIVEHFQGHFLDTFEGVDEVSQVVANIHKKTTLGGGSCGESVKGLSALESFAQQIRNPLLIPLKS